MEKSIASKIYLPDGSAEIRYADGTVSFVSGDSDISSFDLISGIDALTGAMFDDNLEELVAKRKAEGRCAACGELREMTAHGLKDCEICLIL